MPPSTETFGIPELLEMILENATPQDLLLWQRVNKTWQAAIQRSPRIQEKLYFRIKPCTNENEAEVWNPFMDIFFKRSFYGNKKYRPMVTNAFKGKASYATASWKRMFVTSPAITSLEVGFQGMDFAVYSKTISCESGITIGQLAETQKWEAIWVARKIGYDEN